MTDPSAPARRPAPWGLIAWVAFVAFYTTHDALAVLAVTFATAAYLAAWSHDLFRPFRARERDT